MPSWWRLARRQALAQSPGPLRIEITEGVIEPLPVAIPRFVAETRRADAIASQIAEVVAADLQGSGLFRAIDGAAFISGRVQLRGAGAVWRLEGDQRASAGHWVGVGVAAGASERQVPALRCFRRSPTGRRLATGWNARQLAADCPQGRRFGLQPDHRRGWVFRQRVVFVAESGSKGNRSKRLAIMDFDGANAQYLTDARSLVLAPRISPQGDRVLFTSYETGFPRIYLLNLSNMQSRLLDNQPGTMTFAPRFSPDGNIVLYSLTNGGNTDLYTLNLRSGRRVRLTSAPSIETAPSYSPDGARIVFESDRSGSQQIYVMDANGSEPRRISFGTGRYGTPVWSPRGDLIAYTKQSGGRFHIGVMRTDGSEERLLTASFLDEGPTWSPNGRVIMFTRETRGAAGAPALYSVDITGRNLKRVAAPGAASAPAWSPLLP